MFEKFKMFNKFVLSKRYNGTQVWQKGESSHLDVL